MNVIFGSGGFAKEVDWLTYDIFKTTGVDYRAEFFVVSDDDSLVGTAINNIPVVAESGFFALHRGTDCVCIIAVGEPRIKEKIVNKIKSNMSSYSFPNLIHPDIVFDERPGKVIFGVGNILCSNASLTTDIVIKNFVVINLDCTIGHESIIGDYSTLSPGAHISGNVHIAERVYVGTGAVIIQNKTICSDSLIGAGSVVSKDIVVSGTYVGIPARKIK